MAIFETTVDALVERLGRLVLHDWREGTATGGTTATIIDTVHRDEPDDFFQNTSPVSRAYIRTTTDGATPIGEERKAIDFVNSSATLTVAPVYSVAPAAGDTYVIMRLFRWAELREAINSAIDQVKSEVLIPKIDDTSVSLAADAYEYTLPSDFVYINRLQMADDSENFFDEPVPPMQYRIVKSSSSPRLLFLKAPESIAATDHYYSNYWFSSVGTAGRKLRIEGLQVHPTLENDTDICYVNPNYIAAQAGAWLHLQLASRSDMDADAHMTQFNTWQAIANQIRMSQGFKTQLPPNSKKVGW